MLLHSKARPCSHHLDRGDDESKPTTHEFFEAAKLLPPRLINECKANRQYKTAKKKLLDHITRTTRAVVTKLLVNIRCIGDDRQVFATSMLLLAPGTVSVQSTRVETIISNTTFLIALCQTRTTNKSRNLDRAQVPGQISYSATLLLTNASTGWYKSSIMSRAK